MKVVFHTNLDLVNGDKYGWPTELPFRPQIGDLIESCHEHPSRKEFRLTLRVSSIRIVNKYPKPGWPNDKPEFSHLAVELHLPENHWQSLKDFYNFYERLTGRKFI